LAVAEVTMAEIRLFRPAGMNEFWRAVQQNRQRCEPTSEAN